MEAKKKEDQREEPDAASQTANIRPQEVEGIPPPRFGPWCFPGQVRGEGMKSASGDK